MARVAALGEPLVVAGYALAGAVVLPAEGESQVRAAWDDLPEDVDVVLLTAAAARCLGQTLAPTSHPLTVVIPS
jgi:vacuolar-type H+-ATPase subunit F/Vma7